MRLVRALDLAGWGVTVVIAAAWLALVEVFWLPLRVGGVLFPISIVAAVAGNLLLTGLALRWSGSRVVAVLPGVAWGIVAVAAMSRRPEGDLVLTGNGAVGVVNLAFLLFGVLAAAVAIGRVLGSGPAVRHRESGGSGAVPSR